MNYLTPPFKNISAKDTKKAQNHHLTILILTGYNKLVETLEVLEASLVLMFIIQWRVPKNPFLLYRSYQTMSNISNLTASQPAAGAWPAAASMQ